LELKITKSELLLGIQQGLIMAKRLRPLRMRLHHKSTALILLNSKKLLISASKVRFKEKEREISRFSKRMVFHLLICGK